MFITLTRGWGLLPLLFALIVFFVWVVPLCAHAQGGPIEIIRYFEQDSAGTDTMERRENIYSTRKLSSLLRGVMLESSIYFCQKSVPIGIETRTSGCDLGVRVRVQPFEMPVALRDIIQIDVLRLNSNFTIGTWNQKFRWTTKRYECVLKIFGLCFARKAITEKHSALRNKDKTANPNDLANLIFDIPGFGAVPLSRTRGRDFYIEDLTERQTVGVRSGGVARIPPPRVPPPRSDARPSGRVCIVSHVGSVRLGTVVIKRWHRPAPETSLSMSGFNCQEIS